MTHSDEAQTAPVQEEFLPYAHIYPIHGGARGAANAPLSYSRDGHHRPAYDFLPHLAELAAIRNHRQTRYGNPSAKAIGAPRANSARFSREVAAVAATTFLAGFISGAICCAYVVHIVYRVF